MAYNGWKNKETWLVNVWLGDNLTMDQEDGIQITAEYVEAMVEEMLDDEISGLISDLLGCALGEVDYHEIEDHYKEEE